MKLISGIKEPEKSNGDNRRWRRVISTSLDFTSNDKLAPAEIHVLMQKQYSFRENASRNDKILSILIYYYLFIIY